MTLDYIEHLWRRDWQEQGPWERGGKVNIKGRFSPASSILIFAVRCVFPSSPLGGWMENRTVLFEGEGQKNFDVCARREDLFCASDY